MNSSSKLIDTFPLVERKNHVKERVRQGVVIKARFPGIASYEKYFVFVGLDNDFRNVHGYFINSDPHPLSSRNLHIQRAQVEIDPGTYGFLTYPTASYIYCGDDPYSVDFFEIISALVECPSKINGHLKPEHLQWVFTAIQNSRTLSPDQKNLLTGDFILPADFLA